MTHQLFSTLSYESMTRPRVTRLHLCCCCVGVFFRRRRTRVADKHLCGFCFCCCVLNYGGNDRWDRFSGQRSLGRTDTCASSLGSTSRWLSRSTTTRCVVELRTSMVMRLIPPGRTPGSDGDECGDVVVWIPRPTSCRAEDARLSSSLMCGDST